MSEQTHHHHHSGSSSGHHHHHHKIDGATRFKRKSLMAIERRKIIAKWAKRILVGIAVVLAIYVAIIYVL